MVVLAFWQGIIHPTVHIESAFFSFLPFELQVRLAGGDGLDDQPDGAEAAADEAVRAAGAAVGADVQGLGKLRRWG